MHEKKMKIKGIRVKVGERALARLSAQSFNLFGKD